MPVERFWCKRFLPDSCPRCRLLLSGLCWRPGAHERLATSPEHHTPQSPVWTLGRHCGYVRGLRNLCPEAAPRRARICSVIWPVQGAPEPDFGVKIERINFRICRMNFRMNFLGNAPHTAENSRAKFTRCSTPKKSREKIAREIHAIDGLRKHFLFVGHKVQHCEHAHRAATMQ